MPATLSGDDTFVALSLALDAFEAAEEAWSDNIDCTFCESEDVEPTLQGHWTDAALEIEKAASALDES
jgi:hypothetical protein